MIGASVMIGKALENPVKGMAALTKAGVALSPVQQKLVKDFMAAGEAAKAQDIILKELEKEYGGQAEAATKAGLGPLEKLGIIWDNIKESFGNVLIPLINKFATVIGDAFDSISVWVKESAVYIIDFINGWIDLYNESVVFRFAVESIGTTFSVMWKSVKLVFSLMYDAITGTGKLMGYVFNPKNWGKDFQKGLTQIIVGNSKEVLDDVKDYGKEVGKRFEEGINSIVKGGKKHLTLEDAFPVSDSMGKSVKKGGVTGSGKSVKQVSDRDVLLQNLSDSGPSSPFDKQQEDQIEAARKKAEELKKINEDLIKSDWENADAEKERLTFDAQWEIDNEKWKNDQILKEKEKLEQAKRDLEDSAWEAGQQIITDQIDAAQEEKIDKIKTDSEAQQEILKNQLDKGLITEAEYNDKLAVLKKKALVDEAKANRKKSLFDIAIDTLKGMAKAVAESPLTFGLPFLPYVIAQGAISAALVAAKPIPSYGGGVNDIVDIGGSHSSGNDVDVWGFSGSKKQFFGKVERGEAMPVIRKSAVNDYQIAKLNGKFSSNNRTFANGTTDIVQNGQQIDSKELLNNMMIAFSNVNIVAKIEDITKQASRKIEIIENSKV
jgi:hypothetical protein